MCIWQPNLVFLPGKSYGEEPGGLQSMGSRVRQNLATKPYITHLKLRLKPKFLSTVVIQNKL